MDNTNKLEQQFAKRYGGQAVKNSGRGMNKGDAVIAGLLVDTKFTDKSSYSINLAAFKKHANDAFGRDLAPCVVPVFQKQGEMALAIVEFDYLLDLIEYKNMYEGLCK